MPSSSGRNNKTKLCRTCQECFQNQPSTSLATQEGMWSWGKGGGVVEMTSGKLPFNQLYTAIRNHSSVHVKHSRLQVRQRLLHTYNIRLAFYLHVIS